MRAPGRWLAACSAHHRDDPLTPATRSPRQPCRLDEGTRGAIMTAPVAPFPVWAWFVFGAGLVACIAVDLILHRGARLRSHAAAIAVELTDIVFAIDSVPAALAISPSRFVVYSSNALAVLGLRSVFVLLEDLIGELKYLHYGLAAVLGFSAMKLATARWIVISPVVSIGII